MQINKIDLDFLKNDILNSDFKTKPEKELPKLCKQYDTILQTILNKHAPLGLLTKTVSERPPTPWMTQEILEAKARQRRLERVWRITRYRCDRSLCNRIMEKAKANFYANIILDNFEDPKTRSSGNLKTTSFIDFLLLLCLRIYHSRQFVKNFQTFLLIKLLLFAQNVQTILNSETCIPGST